MGTSWHALSAILKWLMEHLLIGAAGLCLLISIFLALKDRVAAGTLVAGLFVIIVLFHYLPQMESFKAYGIEAKWQARLREADEILRKLRQSALASAQLTYMTLGWGSRMRGPSPRSKQRLADQVDAVLLDLGVADKEIAELKSDYLFFASCDLFQLFEFVVHQKLNEYQNAANAELHKLPSADDRGRSLLQDKMLAIQGANKPTDLLSELTKTNFRALCDQKFPENLFSDVDAEKLRGLGEKLSSFVEESYRSSRIVPAALELLDKPVDAARRAVYRELFGADYS